MGGCGAAVLGAGVIALLALGKPGFDLVASALTLDGYDAHLLGGYSAIITFVVEALLTGGFLMVIIGAIDARSTRRSRPCQSGSR